MKKQWIIRTGIVVMTVVFCIYTAGVGMARDCGDRVVSTMSGNYKSLPPLNFVEEWDNGLIGNYPWVHHTSCTDPSGGTGENVIEDIGDGILFKDNIRYIAQTTACVNESFIDFSSWAPGITGMWIDKDTILQFKIDDLTINEFPPAPPEQTTAFQYMLLDFNNGLNIEFSQDGHFVYINPTTMYYAFPLGQESECNIYSLLEPLYADPDDMPETMYLEIIGFIQQLLDLEEPSTVEHHQHMETDYIRILNISD